MSGKGDAKWPEATEYLETLGATLEDMKRTAKLVFPCLTEVCQTFDQYGKSCLRSSRTFSTVLQGLDTAAAGSLCGPLLFLARDVETTSTTLSAQFAGLSPDVVKADFFEEALVLRKGLSEEIQGVAKELFNLKSNHDKLQAKYEKQVKEMENAAQAEEKAKENPAQAYQVSATQKLADKTRELKIQVHDATNALNEARQKVNTKLALLETTIQGSQDRFFTFEQKALQSAYHTYTLLLSIMKTVVATTQSTPGQSEKRAELIANLTQDMGNESADPESQRSAGVKYNAEYLLRKAETRVRELEERSKAVKALRAFAADIGAAEDILGKALLKIANSYSTQTQYLKDKDGSSLAWKEMMALVQHIAAVHTTRASAYSGDILSQLTGVVAQEGPLAVAIREAAREPIKQHSEVEGESAKSLEKAQKHADPVQLPDQQLEIAAKRLESASQAEERVNSVLEDCDKTEAAHLALVKTLLQRLFDMETEMKHTYREAVNSAEGILGAIDVKKDSELKPVFRITSEQPLPLVQSVEIPAKEEEKEEGLMTEFGLPPETEIINSYSCALQQGILLQGKMYLTKLHICFKSTFNSTTLVGRSTIITIPIKDITKVEKRTIALIVQNAIAIITGSTEMVFASFLKRDLVIAGIDSLRSLLAEPVPAPTTVEVAEKSAVDSGDAGDAGDTGDTKHFTEKMFPEEQLTLKLFKIKVDFDGTAKETFAAFFETSEFWMKYLGTRKDENIEITQWEPKPAGCFGQGKWGEICKRTITYKHPVREKVPFMPSTCSCTEDWSLYCFSPKKFVVESAVTVAGVPMADTFVVKMRWNVEETEGTNVDVQYGVHFVKDTWFKSKIQGNSVSEATEALNDVWIPLATAAWKERPAPAAEQPSTDSIDLASIAQKLTPDDQLKISMFKEEVAFAGSAKDVFECFFSTPEFWTKYMSPRGDTNITITEWEPVPPEFYWEKGSEKWIESSSRKFAYTHPVREKMPFVPSTCACTEEWTAFWLSHTAFLIDCTVVVTGVPMSDVFVVKMRWNVSEVAENTKVEVKYGVHFVKDSWFKGKIEKSSVSEATEALNDHWIPIARREWEEFAKTKAAKKAVPPPISPSVEKAEQKPQPEPQAAPQPAAAPARVEVPVKPIAQGRDPLVWVLLVLVLFLFFQVSRLSSRLAVLESLQTS